MQIVSSVWMENDSKIPACDSPKSRAATLNRTRESDSGLTATVLLPSKGRWVLARNIKVGIVRRFHFSCKLLPTSDTEADRVLKSGILS